MRFQADLPIEALHWTRFVLVLAVLFTLLPLQVSPAKGQSGEGFGRGFITPGYGGIAVQRGVPLLQTFYFRFDRGNDPIDHHINAILVLPSGRAQDLSPNADLPRPTVARGRIGLMFQDKSKNDRYFYRVAHTAPLNPGPERRFSLRDVGCVGQCQRRLPRPPVEGSVFVLVGFELFFTGDRDHHVDQVAVFERNGTLTVKLRDKKPDDVFGYLVEYAWLAPSQVRRTGTASGEAAGGERARIPAGRAVIRGFQFNYRSKDHHLREIGVLNVSSSRLEVFFGDKNGDDRFQWAVDWALLAPPVLAPGS